MEVTQKPKSPIPSPNNIRNLSSKIISPKLKFDFNYRLNTGVRRKCSEKKYHPLKMIFVHDPLNLDSLTSKSNGIESPNMRSPVPDRSCEFQPRLLQPVDLRDPLSLNCLDDTAQILTPLRKRRKRKRRFSAGDPYDTLSFSMTEISPKKSSFKFDTQKNNVCDDLLIRSDPSCVECKKEKTSFVKKDIYRSLTKPNLLCEKKKKKEKTFTYGNYIKSTKDDERLSCFSKQWFFNKNCLDIGCNNGKVTLEILKRFDPSFITGVDIDDRLIKLARSYARNDSYMPSRQRFPVSIKQTYGPMLNTRILQHGLSGNICFITQNYVPCELDDLSKIKEEYDTITCLSVTMWVQLNFGDSGLKRMFKKIFMQLKPGGKLLLEPQLLKSYKKKKNLSITILHHFKSIKLFPNDFVRYLLSKEIGFATSECLIYTHHKKTGGRPLFLLTKSSGSNIV
ncbi:uncharacterized protein LOC100197255 [Hydra vulgaris]|uniref:uncharacterized protein LOC100197255 n=1 Tax=Hydra vulgaris TaxID=6087 RepID=UPI0006411172|nr:probable RNA methyltransferase At5g51130 [Hydra vulgaris]